MKSIWLLVRLRLQRVLRATRDLVLLAGDYTPRAAASAKRLAVRALALARGRSAPVKEKVTRESPRARKLGRWLLAMLRDLVLLAGDYAPRTVPPAKRLALRAVPPAQQSARLARKHLVLPARNLGMLLALVVLCVGLAQTSPGHVVLADAGLFQRPASYTELTFTAPGELPSSVPAAESAINLSFDIHNVSGAARVYQWSVVLAGNGHSRVGASGTASAPAQGRVTVTRSVAATCSGTRLQVLVRLASPAESVDFWVTCAAKGGAQ
jgi:hypothetical protein